jgi:hypothetical protein
MNNPYQQGNYAIPIQPLNQIPSGHQTNNIQANSNEGGINLNRNQFIQQSQNKELVNKPTEAPPGGYNYN